MLKSSVLNHIPKVFGFDLKRDCGMIVLREGILDNLNVEEYSGVELILSHDGEMIDMIPIGKVSKNGVLWQNMSHDVSVIIKSN